MNIKGKNVLLAAGVISSILGITFAVPSFIKEVYSVAILSTIFIVGGLVLIAIAIGSD